MVVTMYFIWCDRKMERNVFKFLSAINHRSLLLLNCLCMSINKSKLSKMTTEAEENQRHREI